MHFPLRHPARKELRAGTLFLAPPMLIQNLLSLSLSTASGRALRALSEPHRSKGRTPCHAASFNLFNRDNQRVTITSNGLTAEATTFTPTTPSRRSATFLIPPTTSSPQIL